MNALNDDDVFDFLAGQSTARSDRVRASAAGMAPADADARAALTRFRAAHKDLLRAPGVVGPVRGFMEAEQAAWKRAGLVFDEVELPKPAGPTWRDLYERLLARVRTDFADLHRDAPTDRTAESIVSSVLSDLIAGRTAADDPTKLWPVLVALAEKKSRRKWNPDTAVNEDFVAELAKTIRAAFRDVAKDDQQRVILAASLLGKTRDQIAAALSLLPSEIESDLRVLQANLSSLLL